MSEAHTTSSLSKGKMPEHFDKSNPFLRSTSETARRVDNLRHEMDGVKEDLEHDREGVRRFQERLNKFKDRKDELERRVRETKEQVRLYEKNIGPFEQRYNQLVAELSGLYEDAKEKHAAAVKMLVKEFQYHPAFKRWNEDFIIH